MPETTLPVLLIVDDDKNIRLMLTRLLEGAYRVITAADGAETLRVVALQRPDVVLVDLMLPDATGIELISPIHETDPHLPVILLSGMAKQDVAEEALARGAYDYLVKPLDDFFHLEHVIAGAVEQRRAARA